MNKSRVHIDAGAGGEQIGLPTQLMEKRGAAALPFLGQLAHTHLTKGQIAIAAAKLKDHYAQEAAKRLATNQGGKRGLPPVNLPEGRGDARDAAGKAFGVSGKSVDQAEAILKRGDAELVAKVERGEVSINQGRQIAQYPRNRVHVAVADTLLGLFGADFGEVGDVCPGHMIGEAKGAYCFGCWSYIAGAATWTGGYDLAMAGFAIRGSVMAPGSGRPISFAWASGSRRKRALPCRRLDSALASAASW